MDRKVFLKTCGIACVGAGYWLTFLEGCGATKTINAKIEGDQMFVPLLDFEIHKDEAVTYRKALILRNDALQFPICIFRNQADSYTALLMRCTHQSAELQLFGDKLQCPAHGSEFDRQGMVTDGPASSPLRTFPVVIDNQQLKISLK